MEKINSIKFIDSLAEITRHRDREVIERSLLKTLLEFETDSSFRLYQVLNCKPDLKLGMLAYASNENVITSEEAKLYEIPVYFEQALKEVILTGKIISIKSEGSTDRIRVIYPAFDTNDQIFAILIQTTNDTDSETQHFVHSFLRIYSNYLEMIEVTKRDKLTGLLNRETLNSEITRILIDNNTPARLQNHSHELTNNDDPRYDKDKLKNWLCVIDIDYFKAVNDDYGHIYGDEILILMARLLEKSIRQFDKTFRFGGEEFVILVKAYDATDAILTFERIRHIIETHQYAKIPLLTVSIGGTEIIHQNDPRDVIEEADNALYYAKNNGRNQVHLYEDLIKNNKITASSNSFPDSEIDFF